MGDPSFDFGLVFPTFVNTLATVRGAGQHPTFSGNLPIAIRATQKRQLRVINAASRTQKWEERVGLGRLLCGPAATAEAGKDTDGFVIFKVECSTESGESVGVTGSCKELGSWEDSGVAWVHPGGKLAVERRSTGSRLLAVNSAHRKFARIRARVSGIERGRSESGCVCGVPRAVRVGTQSWLGLGMLYRDGPRESARPCARVTSIDRRDVEGVAHASAAAWERALRSRVWVGEPVCCSGSMHSEDTAFGGS